ncbi:MAG: hypothetical protein H0V82_02585 [Candidatus Protochlamydia sp.]|nr:hypothetical protein [Candidatus Protochlamydia sp.]
MLPIFPKHCPICPSNGVSKAIPDHKYGDYIILKPNEASCHEINKLSQIYKSVLINEIPQIEQNIKINSTDEMHLTLAMPLRAMKRKEVADLLNRLNQVTNQSQTFDMIFRDPKKEGSYRCVFGSPNYSPNFDIRLSKPAQNYYDHHAISSHDNLMDLADNIHKYCEENKLVDISRNSDGSCNAFKPHISLGKITGENACELLHNREKHSQGQKQLSYLVSSEASKVFGCKKQHKHCSSLPLKFDRIEILRCDSQKGVDHQTTCLGSLDLNSKTISLAKQFPGCNHKG